MQRVVIVSGAYGRNVDGRVKPVYMGESCVLEDKEAERLIALKVAEKQIESCDTVATSADADNAIETDSLSSETKDASERATELQTAHLDFDDLLTYRYNDLKKLAKDMGIQTSGCKTKEDYARAISGEEVRYEVNAEEPV